jgi:hypothetical protein
VLIKAALVGVSLLAIAWSDGTRAIRADIDGDGSPDQVSLTSEAHGFVLRVRTSDRIVTTTQKLESYEPRILALRPLNARQGPEIEVLVDQGAANEFIAFYTLLRGRLIPLRGAAHAPADPSFVWSVGGTVGTGTTEADCVGRGQIGVIDRWHHRGIWHYKATRYEVEPTRFVRTAVYELASERRVASLPKDWPRVKGFAFQSCAGIELPQ